MDHTTLHAIEALGDVLQRTTRERGITFAEMGEAMLAAIRTELGAPPTADSLVLRQLVDAFQEMLLDVQLEAEGADYWSYIVCPRPSLRRVFLETAALSERPVEQRIGE